MKKMISRMCASLAGSALLMTAAACKVTASDTEVDEEGTIAAAATESSNDSESGSGGGTDGTTYTVTFYDSDGQTVLKTLTVTGGDDILYKDCPTKDGQIATWYSVTTSDTGRAPNSVWKFSTAINNDRPLIVSSKEGEGWQDPNFSVTFYADSSKSKTYTLAQQAAGNYGGITLPGIDETGFSVEENKAFTSWNKNAAGGSVNNATRYEAGANYNIYNKGTAESPNWSLAEELYAIIVTPYTVTFDANAAVAEGSMAALTGDDTYTLTANAFSQNGYVFGTWNTAANGSGTSYSDKQVVTFSADTTLYAQWTAVCGITFNANGGSGSMESLATDVSHTLTAQTLTPPTGKVFSHWNTKEDGSGIGFTDQSPVTITSGLIDASTRDTSGNVILYAQWYEEKTLAEATAAIAAVTDANAGTKLYLKVSDAAIASSDLKAEGGLTAALKSTKAKIFLDFSGCTLTTSNNGKEFEGTAGVTDAGLVGIVLNSPATILPYTFKNSLALTSVVLGSGVTNIKGKAFENCTGLKYVTVHTGYSWVTTNKAAVTITDPAGNGANLAPSGSWYEGGIWKN